MAWCEVAMGDTQDSLDEIEQIMEDTTQDTAVLVGVLKNSKISLMK